MLVANLIPGLWLAAGQGRSSPHSQSFPTVETRATDWRPTARGPLRAQRAHPLRHRLIGARDLIIDSTPILAWRRVGPDAAFGRAPAQHPRPLLPHHTTTSLSLPLHSRGIATPGLW